ncbi:glycoside hydrolase family 78 protein [Saccharibacillus sp. CPCC 101409]|uniref:glycoside hydrolase family 78 protein n=1 Tax=Saccharibacillus sp. CPCC 101409 TaxID=3058041 RepID=UPI0026716760|nr:glycoside hydrolase family 78 protein [Saccharibacillus sp. CPCC 101409]MDO3410522.1 glycoside hydrolase family 78 protein [Saccharibacillus sp. CPCC 101409]
MSSIKVVQPRCEYLDRPLGLTVRTPRIGWKLEAPRRNVRQSAYRIQVSREDGSFAPENLVWDSGQVRSDESVHAEYAGKPLESAVRYVYRIKVWDERGEESGWSESAYWETGLLDAADWRGQWITPSAQAVDPQARESFYLRRAFDLNGRGIRRATLLATALGLYELELDGERVGDSLFTPGWTSYHQRLQVQAYDVTERLAGGGEHAIGAALADGWYIGRFAWKERGKLYGDRRALLLQLHVIYDDGKQDVIVSDDTWRSSADGPIRVSNLYDGETYDASLELGDWSRGGFDDSAWHPVEILPESKDRLIGEQSERIKVTEKIKPISVITTPAGETVLDMGQNMVGRVHVTIEAPAGTTVKLHHAEVLDQGGNFYTGNLRTARQETVYICKGGGEESFRPSFSFQGFRYVRLEGFPGPVDPGRFTGEVIHTDMQPTGSFECSNPLIDQLQRNIVWGQRGNFLDIPTDCPQRDERLGWTGDAQVFARTASFNYGVAPFFTKWLKDLAADQRPDGGVPFVIPHTMEENAHSSAAWGDAATIGPWTIYLCYGDKRILAEQYDSMKGWVEYIRAQGDNELLWNTGFHYGDWLGLDAKENSYVGATPTDLIATAFYAYSTSLLSKSAAVLGYEEDAGYYAELQRRIAGAFADEFITPNGRLAGHTQTSHVLVLMFDLAEGETKRRLADTLAGYIREQKMHLTTGFVGTPYLCHVLSENGYHDLAVQLVQQEEYPSWLYSVRQGATTIWEHWDGIKPDGSFWSDDMNSYNHYAYGAIGDWLYRVVTGIDTDEKAPGYKRIKLRPRPDSGLDYARASYESLYGTIASGWTKSENGTVEYTFEIPANTTAEVRLPLEEGQSVRPGDEDSGELPGAEVVHGGGAAVFELGSGRYTFTVQGG